MKIESSKKLQTIYRKQDELIAKKEKLETKELQLTRELKRATKKYSEKERKARNHRLITWGAVLEPFFPFPAGITKDDIYNIFTLALKHYDVKRLKEKIVSERFPEASDDEEPSEKSNEPTEKKAIESVKSPTMAQTLFGAAAVLFLLILLAGVLMISSSMNSTVAQRTKFFGMMRCIGMSREQIIRFVRLEALNWCKTAVPIGVLLGVVTVWK